MIGRVAAPSERSAPDGLTSTTVHPWDIVRRARCPDRPNTTFYLASSVDNFFELHGDRRYRDDPTIRGGIAWLGDQQLMVIGHERGGPRVEDQILHNFGMSFPEGYHKARRLMRLADHFRLPIMTLIDTPGAYPGLGAEARGQAGAIAKLLLCMAGLTIPTISVIIGQGGSGGGLALALADRVLILENAIYSVISPEGCASILWRSTENVREAAAALRLTAHDLLELGVVDEVIPEPSGGIALCPTETATRLRETVARHLHELQAVGGRDLRERRAAKYAAMGVFTTLRRAKSRV